MRRKPLGQQPAEEPGSTQAVVSEPSAEADKSPDAAYRRGLELMGQVYGPGFSDAMPKSPVGAPFTDATVNYLFGEVWSRPALSVRDRRLLVLGATAALGRGDLIRIQTEGALINGELDAGQLREAALHLALYVGWGNATAVRNGFEEAIAAQKDATPPLN